MEIKDWITLLSAFIVAIGWFVNGYLNRINNVAQKRVEYRIEALETFLPILMALHKVKDPKVEDPFKSPEFCKQFEDAQVKFQLYGYKDEEKLMSSFTENLLSKNLMEAKKDLKKLATLIQTCIRKELKINS